MVGVEKRVEVRRGLKGLTEKGNVILLGYPAFHMQLVASPFGLQQQHMYSILSILVFSITTTTEHDCYSYCALCDILYRSLSGRRWGFFQG